MSEAQVAVRDPSNQTLAPALIPHLNVEGASDASAFYQRAFAATELFRMPHEDGTRLMHCRLEINGAQVMLADCFTEMGHAFQPSHSFNLTLIVSDGDLWWNRAVEAGCTVVAPFKPMFWGDRWGVLIDPFGIQWAVDEPGGAKR